MEQAAFIDTNIFIRYLTKDDPVKYRACLSLFKKAESNKAILTTSESVVAEVVFVLSSRKHYGPSRKQIQVALSRLLILPGFRVSNHGVFIRALGIYAQHTIDFEDCLTIAHMEQAHMKILYSYDQDFDRLENILRQEPEVHQS